MTTKLTGGCQCGDVRYEVTGVPQHVVVCHCTDCQRQSGSAFGMTLVVKETDFRLIQGELNTWASTSDTGRAKLDAFCPGCGTRIYHKPEWRKGSVSVKPGIRQGYLEVWPLIEGDVVITFSPDGNSIPGVIPELVAKMREGYDKVIASRYKDDAESEDDDIVTGFGNWLFTRTVNILFGGSYTDVMVIYRAYKKDMIARLELDKDDIFNVLEKVYFCPPRGSSWEPMLAVLALKYGYKIGEFPASEPPRIGGERKLQALVGAPFITRSSGLNFSNPKNNPCLSRTKRPKHVSGPGQIVRRADVDKGAFANDRIQGVGGHGLEHVTFQRRPVHGGDFIHHAAGEKINPGIDDACPTLVWVFFKKSVNPALR